MEHNPDKKGISRRKLFELGIGGALAGFGMRAVSGERGREKVSQESQDILKTLQDPNFDRDNVIQKTQRFLQRAYGIRIEFTIPEGANLVHAKPCSREEIRYGLPQFFEALGRYPSGFFTHSPLPRVIFARGIRILDDDREMKGGRLGVALPEENWVAIDAKWPQDEFEGTVHHEFFHIFARRDTEAQTRELAEWERITEEAGSTPYGYVPPELHRSPLLGPFTEGYGATNPYEDQATFASAMLLPNAHLFLLVRMENEPNERVKTALREKYNRMKALYASWSGGRMNEAYWQDFIMTARDLYPPSIAEMTMTDETGLRGTHTE